MTKILFAALTTFSLLFSQSAFAQHSSEPSSKGEKVVNVIVENLVPHENAFDIMPKGSSEIYHLENAARMSMTKMRALNASLENKTSVKLKIKGSDVVDIILP